MRPVHLSMIRGFHLADFLTLANAACGVLAVFAVLSYVEARAPGRLLLATALIPLALIFDVLDGRVARSRQKHSAMGRELDSLADVISFGVAPAVIAYGAGMRGLWDVVILVYFVCCGVSRLARFNVTVVALAAWLGRIGNDLPFGVLQLGPGRIHPLTLAWALSGSLMISKTLRIPKL
jgi:CDP-diacylglycerol--serine O-phosphatidyltransferase